MVCVFSVYLFAKHFEHPLVYICAIALVRQNVVCIECIIINFLDMMYCKIRNVLVYSSRKTKFHKTTIGCISFSLTCQQFVTLFNNFNYFIIYLQRTITK